jgi:2-oxoglutarate ferredoxin oxidoreductase subunit alpha
MIDHYHAKIESAADRIALYSEDLQPGAETLVISYGVTSRSAAVAVRRARQDGNKVSSLVLRTLYPVPETVIRRAAGTVRRVVVPEMNMGQYVLEVERLAPAGVDVVGVGKMNTTLLSPSEILEKGTLA